MPEKVSILGAGGHSGVVAHAVKASKRELEGVYDDSKEAQQTDRMGFTVCPMASMPQGSPAVIAIGANSIRRKVAMRFPTSKWVTVVHPMAYIGTILRELQITQ